MRRVSEQSGRGGLGLLLFIAVLGIAALAAWTFVHQDTAGLQVTSSAAAADSGRQKALAFAAAEAEARRTGRPVSVVETFSDAELSSLANEAAQLQGLPIDSISLHSTGQGTVMGRAQAHLAGQSLPVTMEASPVVTGDVIALNVTSTRIGALPVPGPLSDQITQAIKQPLRLGTPISGFQDLQVRASDGALTVSGVAQPS